MLFRADVQPVSSSGISGEAAARKEYSKFLLDNIAGSINDRKKDK
jgi:hypothetical protein